MSKLPLTEQQKDNIRQGVLRFYASPAGQIEIEGKKGKAPGNKGKPGPAPWNKGLKGVVKLSREARKRISDNSGAKKSICQYSKDMELIQRWPSIIEASRVSGICYMSLVYAVTGRRKTAGGFKWRYYEG